MAPRTPNSHCKLRDKLRTSSPTTYIRLTESFRGAEQRPLSFRGAVERHPFSLQQNILEMAPTCRSFSPLRLFRFDQFDQIQQKRAENADKNRTSVKPSQQVPPLRARFPSYLAEHLAPCLAAHCLALHQLTARRRVSAARGLRCPIFETTLLHTG